MNEHRSYFFPMLLIGAGVLWLMINLGYIPNSNLWALAHIWPILLIGTGLGLILRQYWSEAGIVVSTLVVLAAILAVVVAPQLGWTDAPAWGFVQFDINGSIPGSRNMETETRTISGFTDIDLRYPAEVTVQQGADESVAITADDNLLPQLSTQVSGNTLSIFSNERNWNRRVNASKTVQITITVADLREFVFSTAGSVHMTGLEGESLEIRLDGAGNIELFDLDLGSLSLTMNGAGSVTAGGSADELKAELNGLGSLNAEGLNTQTAEVRLSGLGSAEVSVSDELTVRIEGAGSVTYHGSPTVHEQVDGLGTINKASE